MRSHAPTRRWGLTTPGPCDIKIARFSASHANTRRLPFLQNPNAVRVKAAEMVILQAHQVERNCDGTRHSTKITDNQDKREKDTGAKKLRDSCQGDFYVRDALDSPRR